MDREKLTQMAGESDVNAINKEQDFEDQEEEDEEKVVNLRIQNVVATLSLNTRVDLDKIASTARNAEYNPRRLRKF